MRTQFDHGQAEPAIFARWEAERAFEPAGDGEPFCVPIPPPNVTGALHMGHALNNTLQDVLCRLARMRGRRVLWQPGIDHAGIATQMVVERHLAEAGEPDRRSLGREAFVERTWRWKERYGETIVGQLKRLGASCDWSRLRFTLDPGFARAVTEVFVRLHEQGLIYRDRRLVNWDPQLQTAISDLEVESRETTGHLWHFKYPLRDGRTYPFPVESEGAGGVDMRDYVAVATTRPETMLGDAAVAVHTGDSRYAEIVGAELTLPVAERTIPLIADPYPDPAFGSGAVKITGAHDFNDFEVAKRHDLPLHDVMDDHGRIDGPVPERYRGMDRFEARAKIVEEMRERGLLLKIEERTLQQPRGDRSGTVIEPRLKEQWFVDAKTLAAPAIEAAESGRTRFTPASWTATYFEWMRNIEPWCISRQLWWGHRIPAWYDEEGGVHVARTEEEARGLAEARLGPDVRLRRDEDVLDTWFSSALWPFATLGWPEKTPELAMFYPASVLVTGFDIIFYWVARMMMQGIHFMGEPPFPEVHVHALVRDATGAKMSKSKGNVVDPIKIMDVYGADALRFTLAAMAVPGRDIKLSEKRVAGYRNFATKLWNAARFCHARGAASADPAFDPDTARAARDRWIISGVRRCAGDIVSAVDAGRFNDGANAIYRFIWNVFCDWYVEMVKPVLADDGRADEAAGARATLAWTLRQCLVMLHPFMPFITESLWAELGEPGLLMRQSWPDTDPPDTGAEDEMRRVIDLVTHIRSARSDLSVPPGERIDAAVSGDAQTTRVVEAHGATIQHLARLGQLRCADREPETWVLTAHGVGTVALDLAGRIDIARESERIAAEIRGRDGDITAIEGKLANPQFRARAPAEVVAEHTERLCEARAARERLQRALHAVSRTAVAR